MALKGRREGGRRGQRFDRTGIANGHAYLPYTPYDSPITFNITYLSKKKERKKETKKCHGPIGLIALKR